ncbi:FabD/lysophospholipase-like protein [Laetiporus sulphureus 93-53]|uniref:Lysophospholipase n=1 Tax=Laetiporus sulphureus 93-53 TaxID=1314785 RepID=A0A165C8A8_9APHY|nr:FabD/lysophospholipase-like protein [Laetiporus sulphureus 93-53]KZT02374.1 FabD/lysophospholipase-like protein [Laetiporus sulphureus 93-53]
MNSISGCRGICPDLVPCPAGVSLVRKAGFTNQSLSDEETAYISARTAEVIPQAWSSYLTTLLGSNVSALPDYVPAILNGSYGTEAYPNFSIATSGRGYRAAAFGAGVLNALDGRNDTSVRAGTGGLLQAAIYLSGLSGGGWLVASLAQADFLSLPELVFGPTVTSAEGWGEWLTDIDLADPSNSTLVDVEYRLEAIAEVLGKLERGFPVSITDSWARLLARHFVNGTTAESFWDFNLTHGAGLTFSSISSLDTFVKHLQPFPILVIDSVSSQGNITAILNGNPVPLTNPLFEANVYEFGSFDPALAAFTPMQYLGSPNSSICATGFDQIAFIEGISSNTFNTNSSSTSASNESYLAELLQAASDIVLNADPDLTVALVPNAFYGVSPDTFIDANETLLQLVDGGEDGEMIPFVPLLVKSRGVNMIFAIDASNDATSNWADGSAMIVMQDRVTYFPEAYSFPPVPTSVSTFLAHNLTTRPTFFGCNSSTESDEPLIIYLANGGAPFGKTAIMNTSVQQISYSETEMEALLSQTFDVATQGIMTDGGEKDPDCDIAGAEEVSQSTKALNPIKGKSAFVTCTNDPT